MLSQQPHQHTRSALCRFYNQQPSGCLKGDNCPYQHIAADSNSTESNRHANLNDVKSSKRSTICRYYRRNGKCNRGDRCHFLHDTIDTPTASSSSTGEDTQTILERSITQKLTSHYGDQFKGLIKSKKNPENEHDTSSLGKRCTTTTAHLCLYRQIRFLI
ncbi:hypothetical protein BDF22DRAFT_9172 [Syncephalis plumigaleata]|nr:hypothetical protein BDF22DRAFT_9172 [Syncephalis plumigaleata]